MDRQIVYSGAIPLETDLLNTNRNILIALGLLAQDILGTATLVSGFPCAPTSPASLAIKVGPGRLYSIQNVDNTAYSSIAADTTDQILKQGIQLGSVMLSTPAPMTSGFSVNYLIEAGYVDTDTTPLVLSYYNVANSQQALSGPDGGGTAQNTQRLGQVFFAVKSGIPASTGSQTTPAPDSGLVGLYVVTVAFGQTSVATGNISTYSGANFLSSTLSSLNAAIVAEITARNIAVAGAVTSANLYTTTYANSVAATAQAGAIASSTALLQSYITSIDLLFATSTQWYKVATLPISGLGTADSINIKATLNGNGWSASNSCMVDIILGNRNGFAYQWNAYGPNDGLSGIECYLEADGSVSVYAVGSSFAYVYGSIINVGGGASLYLTPSPITSVSGTRIFSTGLPGTYPPLLNAASASTYQTAAQSEAFTIAEANSATANANTFSTSIVNGAITSLETFANSAANTAAAAAQGTAISASEGYTNTVAASTLASAENYANGTSGPGWTVLPNGKVFMWGVFAGQPASPATITFPRSGGFPTACESIQITPIGAATNWDTSNPSASTASFSLAFGASNTPFSWSAMGH